MPLADSRQPDTARAGPWRLRRPAGVLWPNAGRQVFDVGRSPVSGPLAEVVSHCWWVGWRRDRSVPFRSQVLGEPVCHLTVEDADGPVHGFDPPAALVHGVVDGLFEVDLPVAGRVAGVAFRPGGLSALLDRDVRDLTGTVVPAWTLFGAAVQVLATQVLREPDEQVRTDLMTGFVSAELVARLERVRADAGYRLVRAAVALMRSREHVRLASVGDRLGVSPRTLQRCFARYVGVPPTWVLRRYRLRDAATAIDEGRGADLAALAAELGFADQAHLARSFTEAIGVPPSVYRRGTGPRVRPPEQEDEGEAGAVGPVGPGA